MFRFIVHILSETAFWESPHIQETLETLALRAAAEEDDFLRAEVGSEGMDPGK